MKISTWNMQGNLYNNTFSAFTEAKKRMVERNIDVLCLQETGDLMRLIAVQWETLNINNRLFRLRNYPIGTTTRNLMVNIYFVQWGNGYYRCSMAILVRADIDSGQAPVYINPLNDNSIRPVFGIHLTDNTAVYNIHAPSGNTAFACSVIEDALDRINQRRIADAVLAGDFNCPPGTVQRMPQDFMDYYCVGAKEESFFDVLKIKRWGHAPSISQLIFQ